MGTLINAVFAALECIVDGEGVAFGDGGFIIRRHGEDLGLDEREDGGAERRVVQLRGDLQVFSGDFVAIVELQQNTHLISGTLENVASFQVGREARLDFALADVVQPRHLATIELALIIRGETAFSGDQFTRNGKVGRGTSEWPASRRQHQH